MSENSNDPARGKSEGSPEERLEHHLADTFGREARIEIEPSGTGLEVRVEREGRQARGRLSRSFWIDYLAEPEGRCASCFRSFLGHLERQLDPAGAPDRDAD